MIFSLFTGFTKLAICKLCGKDKELVKAHIIPKAFWNLPDQAAGPLAMVSNEPGWKTTPSRIGPYDESILCESCDGEIGKLDQHAVETFLRDKRKLSYQSNIHGLYVYPDANSQLIISFVTSLAWRASVSMHSFFSRVSLGPFESQFLQTFTTGNVGNLQESIVVMEYDQETPVMDPHMSRIEGIKVLAFQAERFLFQIKVDQRSFPDHFKLFALQSNRPVLSLLKKWDESRQRDAMLAIVKDMQRPKFWR